MNRSRKHIEDKLLEAIENRRQMENSYYMQYPLKNAQIAEYYYQNGYINALKFILAEDFGVGLQESTSEIKIKDVIANIMPYIANHMDKCDCHQCITNDVLQYFIRKEEEEEMEKNGKQ
jgi:hypothetical protein